MSATDQPYSDAFRLRRLNAPGTAPARYGTSDGRFQIEQGANGAGSWTIAGDDERLSVVAELDRAFGTLRAAREWLAGSVYAEPNGWLHQPAAAIEDAYYERLHTPLTENETDA